MDSKQIQIYTDKELKAMEIIAKNRLLPKNFVQDIPKIIEFYYGSFIGKYQWFGGDKPIQLKETDVAYLDCLVGLVVLHNCRIVIYVETINQRKEFLNKIHPAFVVLTTNNLLLRNTN